MELVLRVVQGRPLGHLLRFGPGEVLIGRGPECHVRPESTVVSRQHCLLRIGTGGILLHNLGSTNGTLVNGKRVVEDRCLQLGDNLQLGPVVLEVVEVNSSLQRTVEFDAGKTLMDEKD